jgi:hypothetical protein
MTQRVLSVYWGDPQNSVFMHAITVRDDKGTRRYESWSSKNIADIEKEVNTDGNTIRVLNKAEAV